MKNENKKLLDQVINTKLEETLSSEDPEESEKSFEEAMKAISIQNDVARSKKDRIIKCIEIGAGIVLVPTVEFLFRRAFAKDICEFEKEYTWTTSAGRGLSSLFRFK